MVWELDLPHEQLLVLLSLADNADHWGRKCFPGVALTAWKCGYSNRQVQRVLQRLREKGIIEAVARELGGRRPTEYALHLERGPKKEPACVTGDASCRPPSRGDILSPQGRHLSARGDTATSSQGRHSSVTRSVKEPSVRSVNEPSGGRAHAREAPQTTLDETWIASMVDRFGATLGGETGVRERIETALVHKAARNYTDKRAYARNWLQNDVDRLPARPAGAKTAAELDAEADEWNRNNPWSQAAAREAVPQDADEVPW